jgi:hypothetical protein
MVYFRELNLFTLESILRLCRFFSRKEEERRNYRVRKTTFAIHL